MLVMVIVRPLPDTGRRQDINAKYRHDRMGNRAVSQNGMMLVIVIDHEHPHDQQSGKHAANDPQCEERHEYGSGERCGKQAKRGDRVPPAKGAMLPGIRLGSQDQLFFS